MAFLHPFLVQSWGASWGLSSCSSSLPSFYFSASTVAAITTTILSRRPKIPRPASGIALRRCSPCAEAMNQSGQDGSLLMHMTPILAPPWATVPRAKAATRQIPSSHAAAFAAAQRLVMLAQTRTRSLAFPRSHGQRRHRPTARSPSWASPSFLVTSSCAWARTWRTFPRIRAFGSLSVGHRPTSSLLCCRHVL